MTVHFLNNCNDPLGHPLFHENHWFLGIISMDYGNCPNENMERVPEFINIQIYDSLNGSDRYKDAQKTLKEFYSRKISQQFKKKIPLKNIKTEVSKSFLQPNFHDCGPFTIYFLWKHLNDLGYSSNLSFENDIHSVGPQIRKLIYFQ